jgi:RNA polymerase sigma-70 factor (ECF subfamily)
MEPDRTNAAAIPATEPCGGIDPAAFTDLVTRHYDRVYSFAASFTGDAAAAADVTQEVFLKALSRGEQFRRDGDVTSWLYRIAANTCVDNHRKQRRLVPLGEVEEEPAFVVPASQESEAARQQAAAHLRAAVGQLAPRLRAPLLLRYVSGLGYEEIGRVLDIPAGTVASRLCRALRRLERLLAPCEQTKGGRC